MARVNPPTEEDNLRGHLRGRHGVPLGDPDLARGHRDLAKLHIQYHYLSQEHNHTHHPESPLLRIPAIPPLTPEESRADRLRERAMEPDPHGYWEAGDYG